MVKRGKGGPYGGGCLSRASKDGRCDLPGGRAFQERERHAQTHGEKRHGLLREQQVAACGSIYQVHLVGPVLDYFIPLIKPIALLGDFCRGRSWCLQKLCNLSPVPYPVEELRFKLRFIRSPDLCHHTKSPHNMIWDLRSQGRPFDLDSRRQSLRNGCHFHSTFQRTGHASDFHFLNVCL